jgi:hypothetical protein
MPPFQMVEFHTLILFLDAPENPPPECGKTNWRIYIECDWRLIGTQNQTIASDSANDELIFRSMAQIKGQNIRAVAFSDLNFKIRFENGFSLEVLTTSSNGSCVVQMVIGLGCETTLLSLKSKLMRITLLQEALKEHELSGINF